MDVVLAKRLERIDYRFWMVATCLILLPLVLVGQGMVRELESRSLRLAQQYLRADAEDYAMSLLRRLEFAQAEIRHHAKETQGELGGGQTRTRLVPTHGGFELLVPVAGRVMRGEVSDSALFARLGQASSGISRCIYLNGRERVCDRGLGLSGAERVEAQFELSLAPVFDADFTLAVRVAQPRSIALQGVAFTRWLLPVALAGTGLVAGVFMFGYLRRRLRPARELQTAMGSMQQGSFLQQVDITTGDEFEDLGRSFNSMADRVHASLSAMEDLSELDRLILSGAEPQEIVRQVLLLARCSIRLQCCVCLRDEKPSHGMLLELAGNQELLQVDVRLPDELTSGVALVDYLAPHFEEPIADYFTIVHEGVLSGVVVVRSGSIHDDRQRQVLAQLVDRLSVAAASWDRARTLYRQANFDNLTGLLNRQAFSDRLAQCIEGARRRGSQGAVLFMDLDRFKLVNDTEGHLAGDRLLKEIASRLSQHVRSTDIVARLGGDEFAVIVPEYGTETELDALCKKVMEDVRHPVPINQTDYSLDVSIGVALFPRDGTEVSALLMRADVAMYKAKERRGSAFAFFDEQLNLAASQRIVVEGELKRALLGGELGVEFQPKVELDHLNVVGLEALIRWPDKGFGSFTPDQFVPVAEETGLIHEFTDVLVVETLRCVEHCARRGHKIGTVGLNLSAKQFALPGVAQRFLELVSRHGGRPGDFEIEVDESLFLRESPSVVTDLRALRSAGVTIVLDDFGTGYSSLNMLRRLPLDAVKIDRSFIASLDAPAGRRITHCLIEIAQSLGLQVVAECVESAEELEALRTMGCELAQGYLISKPLTVPRLIEFLDARAMSGFNFQVS